MEGGQWHAAATLQTDLPVCPENQETPRNPLPQHGAPGAAGSGPGWGSAPSGPGAPCSPQGDQGPGTLALGRETSPQGPGVFRFGFFIFILFCWVFLALLTRAMDI